MPSQKEHTKRSLTQRLALRSRVAKETVSEFLGTFIMIVSISWFPQFWSNAAFLAAKLLKQEFVWVYLIWLPDPASLEAACHFLACLAIWWPCEFHLLFRFIPDSWWEPRIGGALLIAVSKTAMWWKSELLEISSSWRTDLCAPLASHQVTESPGISINGQ